MSYSDNEFPHILQVVVILGGQTKTEFSFNDKRITKALLNVIRLTWSIMSLKLLKCWQMLNGACTVIIHS